VDNSWQIEDAARTIQTRWPRRPRVGLILGTGLGNLAGKIGTDAVLRYADIPHFPRATALGHQGQLVCGRLAGIPLAILQGRFHAYEGHSLAVTAFPVRVLKRLGIELLIVSNASGGMNPYYQQGDIVVIEDHIHLMPDNPLSGAPEPCLEPRFPEMTAAYDADLIDRALEIARRENFVAYRGVYVAVSGPNYETRAEYRFFRQIGGDVVGMSTTAEVMVAVQLGLRILALSVVANRCLPDAPAAASGEDVAAVAASAEPKLVKIVEGILASLKP
jgi:purine-nucleoside phosphorylase